MKNIRATAIAIAFLSIVVALASGQSSSPVPTPGPTPTISPRLPVDRYPDFDPAEDPPEEAPDVVFEGTGRFVYDRISGPITLREFSLPTSQVATTGAQALRYEGDTWALEWTAQMEAVGGSLVTSVSSFVSSNLLCGTYAGVNSYAFIKVWIKGGPGTQFYLQYRATGNAIAVQNPAENACGSAVATMSAVPYVNVDLQAGTETVQEEEEVDGRWLIGSGFTGTEDREIDGITYTLAETINVITVGRLTRPSCGFTGCIVPSEMLASSSLQYEVDAGLGSLNCGFDFRAPASIEDCKQIRSGDRVDTSTPFTVEIDFENCDDCGCYEYRQYARRMGVVDNPWPDIVPDFLRDRRKPLRNCFREVVDSDSRFVLDCKDLDSDSTCYIESGLKEIAYGHRDSSGACRGEKGRDSFGPKDDSERLTSCDFRMRDEPQVSRYGSRSSSWGMEFEGQVVQRASCSPTGQERVLARRRWTVGCQISQDGDLSPIPADPIPVDPDEPPPGIDPNDTSIFMSDDVSLAATVHEGFLILSAAIATREAQEDDVQRLLEAWGECDSAACAYDLTLDGRVDSADLAVLMERMDEHLIQSTSDVRLSIEGLEPIDPIEPGLTVYGRAFGTDEAVREWAVPLPEGIGGPVDLEIRVPGKLVEFTLDLDELLPPLVGDLNGDGVVGFGDVVILLAQWGTDGEGDLNGDGFVEFEDLLLLLQNWT